MIVLTAINAIVVLLPGKNSFGVRISSQFEMVNLTETKKKVGNAKLLMLGMENTDLEVGILNIRVSQNPNINNSLLMRFILDDD